MSHRRKAIPVTVVCLPALLAPATAGAQAPDSWEFTGSVYAYLPTISGSTIFPPSNGSSQVSVDIDTILDNLNFTFMGSLEARKGQWGLFADVVYMDVNAGKVGSRSIGIGSIGLPADVSADVVFDLKGWVWALGGSYRTVSTPDYTLDLIGGARLLDIEQTLDWTLGGNVGSVPLPDRAGSRGARLQNWDAIVGVKGRYAFGEGRKWFVPYYLDVGTGESHLTWQAMGGLGYSFGWGDVVGVWRYLDYEMKSDKPIKDMNFNGPMISAVFRW